MKFNFKITLLIRAFLFSLNLTAGGMETSDSVRIVQLNKDFGTISDALEYLRSQNIQQDISIQLIYADYPDEPGTISTNGIEMNGYKLGLFGNHLIGKSRIKLNYSQPNVLINHQSNFTLKDIILEGADPNYTGGALFVQQGNTHHITLKNIDVIGGYCGIKASDKVDYILLENIQGQELTGGLLHLGAGDFSNSRKDTMLLERSTADFDMHHVSINNLQMIAPDQNNNVTGSLKKYSGTLFFKRIDHMDIKNISAPNGNGSSGIVVENSRNINIESVTLDDFGYNDPHAKGITLSKCSKVSINNTILKPRVNDSYTHTLYHFNEAHDLKFCHNTGIAVKPYDKVLEGKQLSMVKLFNANLLHTLESPVNISFRTLNSYQATMQVDWQKENHNVFVSHNQYYSLLLLKNIEQRNFELRHNGTALGSNDRMEYVDYRTQYARGVQSIFDYPPTKIQYEKSGTYYLKPNSLGRNTVTDPVCSFDINGNPRSYPTDVGAADADKMYIDTPESKSTSGILSLYPNPAADHLTIQIGRKVKRGRMSIHNTQGQLVKSFGIEQIEEFKIPISLKPGVYLVSIKEGNLLDQKSFMVN